MTSEASSANAASKIALFQIRYSHGILLSENAYDTHIVSHFSMIPVNPASTCEE